MWWFDGNGDWNVYVNISDGVNTVVNISDSLTVNALTGFEIYPTALNFATLTPGDYNQTSSEYFVMNNTGNQEISSGNVQINATDLRGETTPGYALWAGNFSVSSNTGSNIECSENITGSSTQLVNFSFIGIPNVVIPIGNFTKDDGTGQENMYMCLREVGLDLPEQRYSTQNLGSWTIRILMVALAVRRKRKERKRRNYIVPISIFNKKLGALETLSKYMKENLGLSYHDIGDILNRDERTIWTACKKANEKYKGKIKQRNLKDNKEIYLPMEIFGDKEFTVLEVIIFYLKEKGMRYSEIGKLLDRDQRNIWRIYSRVKKKPINNVESLETKVQDLSYYESKEGINIPISIFNKDLGVLESLTKYMKEDLDLSYNEIAEYLHREKSTIWSACNKANEKHKGKLEQRDLLNEVYLPLEIFENKEFTPLESIINYLKQKGMRYSEIGELLDRNQRNIWNIYSRIKKKQ
jgi:DNA-directed RNA polymerase specialized sigma24 family protein